MDDLSSGQIFAITNAARLLWALIALYAAVRFSRWLDARAGADFKAIFARIADDPRSASRYLGCRWLGICLVVAAVFS